MTASESDLADHERLVERVVQVVDAQTTDRQPETVAEHTIVRLLTERTRDHENEPFRWVVAVDDVEAAIEAAVDREEIGATGDAEAPRYRLA